MLCIIFIILILCIVYLILILCIVYLQLKAFDELYKKYGARSKKEVTEVRLLSMKWKNNVNKHDCGVYVMRHMDTYTGNADWDCGLLPDNVSF